MQCMDLDSFMTGSAWWNAVHNVKNYSNDGANVELSWDMPRNLGLVEIHWKLVELPAKMFWVHITHIVVVGHPAVSNECPRVEL